VAKREEPRTGGETGVGAGGATTGCDTVRNVGFVTEGVGRSWFDTDKELEALDVEVRGVDFGLERDATDLDGPKCEAATAERSMKRLYSYLDRIYCSNSLSRSASDMFAGGGFLASFGL
jgi:hypothetical protein